MSRQESIQDRRKTRSGFLLILASISLFIFLIFIGTKYAAQAALFAEKFKKDAVIVQEDHTPPAQPRLDTNVPKYTKYKTIQLEGYAETNSTVKIYINDSVVKETTAGDDSKYSVEISLTDNQNDIWATATDKAGNEGDHSPIRRVTFDNNAPEIEVSEPNEADTVSEKSAVIKGKTEPGASITANGRVGIVDPEGNFTIKYSLQEGENLINLIAIDPAENKTEKEMKLIYEP